MLATGPKLASIINNTNISATASHPKINEYSIKTANDTVTGEGNKKVC